MTDIKLPNGFVVRNVPAGTSMDAIKQRAIESGWAKAEDFPDAETGTALDFLDVGTGLGGALGGAALGTAILPGIGTAIGGVVGGALGTFGGEVAEDVIAGEEIDLDNAAKQAAEGAVIDVAFLGAGKVIRPLAKMLGIGADDIAKKFVPTKMQSYDVGSLESLQQTEQLLRQGGGGLSAAQTGRASKIRTIGEKIGDEGILSQARTASRTAKNMQVLKTEMQRQIDGVDPSFAKSIDDVGKEVFDVINAGRNATMDLYGKGLDEIIQAHGSKRVFTKGPRDAITSFEKKYATDFGTELHEDTVAQITSIRDLFKPNAMSVDSLLKAQKIINRKIREAGDINNPRTFNSTVEHQLTELNKEVGDAITKTLSRIGKDGAAATDYKAVNQMFSEATKGLLPEINKNVVAAAKAGDYVKIGKLLVNSKSQSQIEAMMKSLDTAYSQVKKADLGDDVIKNAKDAKKIVRQSFLSDFFKKAVDESDVYSLANQAKALSGVTETKRLKTILGEDYPQFKALMNGIAESNVQKGGGIFNLALRSREAGILTGGALLGGTTGAIVGAVGVLAVPEVLGRVATNRKAVSKLLELDKAYRKNPNLSAEFVASAVTKIFDELSDIDRQSLSYAIREPAPQNTGTQTMQPDMGAIGDVSQPEAMRQAAGL